MRFFCLLLCFCSLLNASVASAQTNKKGATPAPKGSTTAKDPNKDKAKEAFKRALKHYDLREFTEAIAELKEAYRLFPNALFLFNIAQCYRELGQYTEAKSYYENYLDASPQAKNRADVEKYLKEVKEKLAQQELERKEAERLAALAALQKPKEIPAVPLYKRRGFWYASGGVAFIGLSTLVILSLPPLTDLGNIDILDQ